MTTQLDENDAIAKEVVFSFFLIDISQVNLSLSFSFSYSS